ncbi:hypothetical protein UACE39S_05985 [Ureibacillus acetophenoni]
MMIKMNEEIVSKSSSSIIHKMSNKDLFVLATTSNGMG